MENIILSLFPTPDRLLEATEIELDRALLRYVAAATDDPMRAVGITRDGAVISLFERGGYDCPHGTKVEVQKVVGRAWKRLEDTDLIDEPDPFNGKNGYRVVSAKGRQALGGVDFAAVMVRNAFTREMFPKLPDAAWNAFRVGDYDTAVFESFKAVEVAVRKKGNFAEADFGQTLMAKAFDPSNGPLRDQAGSLNRRKARQKLFEGALGEIRNPKAHSDPVITDTLTAVEEMMTAGALLRIVGGV